MKFSYLLYLFLVLLAGSSIAEAQMNANAFLSATSERTTSTNYYYARPNDLTIIVNVVGFVQRPGRYEVASSIDLLNLVSLAGGPTPDGSLSKVTVTRMMKAGEIIHPKDFHFDLEDLKNLKAEDLVLTPGDVVQVDRTTWSIFRDIFGVVVSAAVITSAVAQVIWASRR